MRNRKIITVAVVAAAVVDSIATGCLTHTSGGVPDAVGWIGLILLFPTILIVGALGLSHDMAIASIDLAFPLVGFLQFLVIFWAGIRFVSFLIRRNHAKRVS
jgi:hypothetical protein